MILSQLQCLQKMAKLLLSELHHISTNFDTFLQKYGNEADIMRRAFLFHVT